MMRGDHCDEEQASLKFAQQILVCLGLIMAGVMVGYGVNPENPALQAMFELVKIGTLPIVTLLISCSQSRK